jgi:hypothetical protein
MQYQWIKFRLSNMIKLHCWSYEDPISKNYMGLTTIRSFTLQFDYVFLKKNIKNVFLFYKRRLKVH